MYDYPTAALVSWEQEGPISPLTPPPPNTTGKIVSSTRVNVGSSNLNKYLADIREDIYSKGQIYDLTVLQILTIIYFQIVGFPIVTDYFKR